MQLIALRQAGMFAMLIGQLWTGVACAEGELQIADGMKVTLEYTLTLPDKTVADSNVGKAPISYVQGAGHIVPGLEKALAGMKAGQAKRVEVSAIDGYGAYSQKKRVMVEKNRVPADIKPGMLLQSSEGQPARVLEVDDKTVVLDMNHPLAGKNLTFDVKILKVEKQEEPAPTEEKKP